uniref:mucin-5AC n=1 Tax=Ciona intestinalis TaxID=7719 RepID=UPI00089DC2B8
MLILKHSNLIQTTSSGCTRGLPMLLSIVLLILYCAEQLSAIQLPQPGNQANVATGTTNLMITATVTTSPSSCTWSGTGLTSTEFYSSAFGRCKTLTPTATHSITCTNVPGGFSTSLTYLTAMTSNASVSLICGSVASVVYSLSMIVKACSSPTPNNVPVNPSSGVYNTRANFQCSHGSTLFYVNGTTGNTATKCLATAEWENEKIVQCWSAPTTTLIGNNTICAGNIATFQCTTSGGVPSLDRVEIYFNQQNQTLVGNTWTSNPLSSSNNGDIVECRAINSYTAMQEYTNLGRDSKTLIVHYSARNPKFETKFTDLLINSSSDYLLRSDETLTINCSADGNPAVTCNWSCSPTNCGSLPNTCEINNLNVVGSTTITCTVGNGVCGGGTTSITQHITVVPQTRVPNIVVDGTTTTASSITRNKTESLSLACGIDNQNEMNTLIVWKKDGMLKSETTNLLLNNLSPEDTGSYSCHTSDAFGNFSSSLYVDVYYAAEGFAVNDGTTSHSNICTWYIATPGPRSCTITFSLNPTTYTTTLTKDGAMVTNDATNQPQTSTSQSFVFTRNQPSFNDSGNYTLRINNGIFENTFTFNISVINEVQPTTTTTPATGGTPPPIPPPDNLGVIIGAAVGGVVAFILIIILVVYCLRKQRNIKQDASSPADRGENGDNDFQGREEVDNPLYATSGLHTSAHGGSKDNSHVNPSFEAGSEKEEVINPLYATSSSNGAKKKTKGGDTYSEVKKKSKNKSEKEEKVNPLYGSSGQPDNAEGAYAEVDKKGKK